MFLLSPFSFSPLYTDSRASSAYVAVCTGSAFCNKTDEVPPRPPHLKRFFSPPSHVLGILETSRSILLWRRCTLRVATPRRIKEHTKIRLNAQSSFVNRMIRALLQISVLECKDDIHDMCIYKKCVRIHVCIYMYICIHIYIQLHL